MVKAILPNYRVCLTEHSRNTATESKPHQGSSTVVEVIQEAVEAGTCHTFTWSSVLTFLIKSVVMGLLLRSIAPSATIMIFSLFIPARFYKEGWWRNNMTEKLRLWLWCGLSEAQGPDDANSQGAEDKCSHTERLCLHFVISNTLLTLLSSFHYCGLGIRLHDFLMRSKMNFSSLILTSCRIPMPITLAGKQQEYLNAECLVFLWLRRLISICRVSMLLVSPFFILRYSHPWQN